MSRILSVISSLFAAVSLIFLALPGDYGWLRSRRRATHGRRLWRRLAQVRGGPRGGRMHFGLVQLHCNQLGLRFFLL